MDIRRAVCLFSGGLDSTTTLYRALKEGYEVAGLTLLYGQTHAKEIEQAKVIASLTGIQHYVISFSLPWGGSSLLGSGKDIPLGQEAENARSGIPSTYVPARNLIFLSLAASLAEVIRADSIFIGVNAVDFSGYPDCRPDFLSSYAQTLQLGTKEGSQGHDFKIQAPLLHLSKKEIIQLAVSLKVPMELTWSCYKGEGKPCGTCDSCVLRRKGFEDAGISDPLMQNETPAAS